MIIAGDGDDALVGCLGVASNEDAGLVVGREHPEADRQDVLGVVGDVVQDLVQLDDGPVDVDRRDPWVGLEGTDERERAQAEKIAPVAVLLRAGDGEKTPVDDCVGVGRDDDENLVALHDGSPSPDGNGKVWWPVVRQGGRLSRSTSGQRRARDVAASTVARCERAGSCDRPLRCHR